MKSKDKKKNNIISESVVEYIRNLLNTAKLLQIESVVIDGDSVRGRNDDGVIILQRENIPKDMPFDAVGFGDVLTCHKRMNLYKDFDLEFELKSQRDGFEYPYKLKFKNHVGKSTVEYKCEMPTRIRAPKRMKDPTAFTFTMDVDSVAMLSKSGGVMAAKNVLLASKNDKVRFDVCDENNNVLSHRVSRNLTSMDEGEYGANFAYQYKIKNILPIFKFLVARDESFEINISSRGFLSIKVNDLTAYILREKD